LNSNFDLIKNQQNRCTDEIYYFYNGKCYLVTIYVWLESYTTLKKIIPDLMRSTEIIIKAKIKWNEQEKVFSVAVDYLAVKSL